MDTLSLIISLVSGILGGNVAGAAMKDKSLGGLGDSIAGFFGGGIGSALMHALGVLSSAPGTEHTLGAISGNVGTSGIGGAILMIIVSLIKSARGKS